MTTETHVYTTEDKYNGIADYIKDAQASYENYSANPCPASELVLFTDTKALRDTINYYLNID